MNTPAVDAINNALIVMLKNKGTAFKRIVKISKKSEYHCYYFQDTSGKYSELIIYFGDQVKYYYSS